MVLDGIRWYQMVCQNRKRESECKFPSNANADPKGFYHPGVHRNLARGDNSSLNSNLNLMGVVLVVSEGVFEFWMIPDTPRSICYHFFNIDDVKTCITQKNMKM